MESDAGGKTGTEGQSEYSPGKTLYRKDEIEKAVTRIAGQLKGAAANYELTFIIILKGGARFACDLMSAFDGPYDYEFIHVSSLVVIFQIKT